MAYKLKSVTIRTENSPEGLGKISELWADIMAERLSMSFMEKGMPVPGLSPVSVYSNYFCDEKGEYDLTVMGVSNEFFAEMKAKAGENKYLIIDEIGENIADSANKAWQKVWTMTAGGEIERAFTSDYESTVPAEYSEDGKAHCYLYIAVK